MCGIVGVAGFLGFKSDKVFTDLLILDSIRGKDSTGMAAVSVGGNVKVVKQVGGPFELMESKQFEDTLRRPNRVLIGHNRAATIGQVIRANAHPFQFDRVVGVHNGTLRDRTKLKHQNVYDVDSEHLYHNINDHGVEEAIKDITGAWALVWWDSDEKTLNMLRNKERPLFYTYSKDKRSIFWASEEWMLHIACARQEVEIEKPISLPVDSHHSWEIPLQGVADSIEPPICKEVKGREVFTKVVGGTKVGTKVSTKTSAPASNHKITSTLVGHSFKFRGIDIRTDKHGSSFLNCQMDNRPSAEIRLYENGAVDIKVLVGNTFEGMVSRMEVIDIGGATPRIYHKVSPHGILMDILEKLPMPIENQRSNGFSPKDHMGHHCSIREWTDRYGHCSNCSTEIPYGYAGSLIDYNSALCEDCAESFSKHGMFH